MRREDNQMKNRGERGRMEISNSRAMGVIVLIALLFVFQVATFVLQKIRGASADGIEENAGSAPQRFRFNPNTITLDSLQLLGFSQRQAQTILNYRSKGGTFRRREDFARMYTVDSAMYASLEEYIFIPDKDTSLLRNFPVRKRGVSGTESASVGKIVRKSCILGAKSVSAGKMVQERGVSGTGNELEENMVQKRGVSGTKSAFVGKMVQKRGVPGTGNELGENMVRKRGVSGTKSAFVGKMVQKRGVPGTGNELGENMVRKRGVSGTKSAFVGKMVQKNGISGAKSASAGKMVQESGDIGAKRYTGESVVYGEKVEGNRYVCNLNTADSAALVELCGIGGYFARKILEYRERLGGSFAHKRQLLEIEGFSQQRYEQIENNIVVNENDVKGFSLLDADRKALERHPYIGPYAARGIITYLRIKGREAFSDELKFLEELVKEHIITENNARRLVEYLLHL